MQISSFYVNFQLNTCFCALVLRESLILNLSHCGKDCVLPNFARLFALTNNCKISITYNGKDFFSYSCYELPVDLLQLHSTYLLIWDPG